MVSVILPKIGATATSVTEHLDLTGIAAILILALIEFEELFLEIKAMA